MPWSLRSLFPYLALGILLLATAWAVSFSTLPPADFTFINGTEIQSVDPARVTGAPEGRIISAIFEGLYRADPKTLEPQPAIALRHELSKDRLTYVFHLRHDAKWTDGTSVTAHDFQWSWQRMLHPETAGPYAGLLYYYVKNARAYHHAEVAVGDAVEVELPDRQVPHKLFPRGSMLFGQLQKIEKPPEPEFAEDVPEDERNDQLAQWKAQWVYTVEDNGRRRRFSKEAEDAEVKKCLHVLLDFQRVGIQALDDFTLQVQLDNPTPYFRYLAAFYPLFPVNRACVERYGFPDWTRVQNIVCNGPFVMQFRRIRDRIRLRKNELYWNADQLKLNTIDALAVQSYATGINMYLKGQVDWAVSPPSSLIPVLKQRDDYLSRPSLITYFYRINVTRPPFNDPQKGKLVRQALNQAIDKKEICERVLKAGQTPAQSIVPPGLEGYELAQCGAYDPQEARRLLGEAGYPDGKGIGTIEILYNTSEGHREIAEVIAGDWEELGLKVQLRNLEWGSYLKATENLEYQVARAGWIGDYPDPNTFLDMFISGSTHNQTGWSNPRYDELIASAARQSDPQKRLQILHEAEEILMDELPILPIYAYVSVNLVKPYVRGFYPNAQDLHPLNALWIDEDARAQYLGRKNTK
ncbi:MAG: peptide ABC transporter substrate-binding protein [Planctomycetota bacterium]|nr:peptide ABC transporter substrate-binding protein [Planctomycetota bacterium]